MEKLIPVQMNEKWVRFTRFPCTEGHIDRWIGDGINDPNNKTMSQLSVNSFTEYYRLNDGKWIQKDHFERDFSHDLLWLHEEHDAKAIWEAYLLDEAKGGKE